MADSDLVSMVNIEFETEVLFNRSSILQLTLFLRRTFNKTLRIYIHKLIEETTIQNLQMLTQVSNRYRRPTQYPTDNDRVRVYSKQLLFKGNKKTQYP